MAYSNYFEGVIANFWKGVAMPAPPPNFFLSLHNGDPTDTGTGGADITTSVRPTGRLTMPASVLNAPVTDTATIGYVLRNNSPLDFGEVQNNNNLTHIGIWDAATGGNLLVVVPIAPPTPRSLVAGAQLVIPPNGIQFGQTTAPETANGLTTFAMNQFLGWFRGTNPTTVPTWYIALRNGSPTISGTGGTESTGTLYPNRVAVSATAGFGPVTQVAGAAQFDNANTIDFGAALTSSFITHYTVHDAATGGNMWWFGPLGVQTTYTAGTPLRFLPGGLRKRIL